MVTETVNTKERRVTIRLPVSLYESIVNYARIECLAPGAWVRTVLAKEIRRKGSKT